MLYVWVKHMIEIIIDHGQAIARKSRSRTPGYAPGSAARALRGPVAAVTAATQVGEGPGEEAMMGFNPKKTGDLDMGQ